MRGTLLLLLGTMLLSACQSAVGDCEPVEIVRLSFPKSFESHREEAEDGTVVFSQRVSEYYRAAITIPIDEIARTDRWVNHQSPPAMPLSRAIDLASQWVARERSDDASTELSGAYLARYGCEGEADYWYYGVSFSPFSLGNDRFESNGATVVVLMDGTVIGPEMLN